MHSSIQMCLRVSHLESELKLGCFIFCELSALSLASVLNKSPFPSHTQAHKSPPYSRRSEQEIRKSVIVADYKANELLAKSCGNYIPDQNPVNKNILLSPCSGS